MSGWRIALLAGLIHCAGCAPERFYNGPERESSEITVIRIEQVMEFIGDNDDDIDIVSVNGARTNTNLAHVEPGPCTLGFDFRNSHEGRDYFSRMPSVIHATCEAGRTYFVQHSYDYLNGTWSVWLTDGTPSKVAPDSKPVVVSDVATNPFAIVRKENEEPQYKTRMPGR